MKGHVRFLVVVLGFQLLASYSPAVAAGGEWRLPPELVTSDPFQSKTPAQKPSDSHPRKLFYVGPRVGVSLLSGMVGIEVQYRQVAIDYGFAFMRECLGVKYFLSYKPHSAYLAGSYSRFDDDKVYGALVGYQARSASGLSVSAGAGIGVKDERKPDGGHSIGTGILVDLTVGCSLGFGTP